MKKFLTRDKSDKYPIDIENKKANIVEFNDDVVSDDLK
jgi:hypothetical protein